MQRVRRVGRDARVQTRRDHPLVGDGRRVVAVDEVVRHAGVVGILLELGFEYRGRLQVGGVRLVGLRLRPGDVEGREDLRLVVGGIALGKRLVGIGACDLTLPLRSRRKVLVIGCHGLDVVALTLRLRADAAALVDRRLCLLRALRRRALSGQRVRHEYRRDPPRGDRALGIVLENVAEGLLAGGIPERMQHRDGAFEGRLHFRIAARRERDLAERTGLGIRVVRAGRAAHEEGCDDRYEQQAEIHGASWECGSRGNEGSVRHWKILRVRSTTSQECAGQFLYRPGPRYHLAGPIREGTSVP